MAARTVCQSSAWQQARWRFLLIHQPPYGQGWPGYAGDDFIARLVEEEAERQRIDFVLSGHIHDYERLRKTFGRQTTHFFVLGGGGGGLKPPASNPFPVMDMLHKQHHYALFSVQSTRVSVDSSRLWLATSGSFMLLRPLYFFSPARSSGAKAALHNSIITA